MSAYSEYSCGALSDDEYQSAMRRECEDYDPYDRFTCRDCSEWNECLKAFMNEEGPLCEQGLEPDNENLFITYAEEYEDDDV